MGEPGPALVWPPPGTALAQRDPCEETWARARYDQLRAVYEQRSSHLTNRMRALYAGAQSDEIAHELRGLYAGADADDAAAAQRLAGVFGGGRDARRGQRLRRLPAVQARRRGRG